jgi:DNA invertase Pin-like site-specific DNA recombinase
MRKLLEIRGWELSATFVDRDESGSKTSRPELDKLLACARSHGCDVVVVWALDRLGRSLKHLLAVSEELRALEVDLVAVTQSIDTTTPGGRLTFSVLGAVAEFEREMIRERVKAGIAKRKAAGLPIGRQKRARTDQVESIMRLRAEGRSWRSIAMAVGLPTSTVRGTFSEAMASRN